MSKALELRELTRVRVLTFLREPEAIFWVFVFPMVLAAVLGFAFRSAGVEPVKVVVLSDDGPTPTIVDVLVDAEHVEVQVMASADEARRLLRRAAVDVDRQHLGVIGQHGAISHVDHLGEGFGQEAVQRIVADPPDLTRLQHQVGRFGAAAGGDRQDLRFVEILPSLHGSRSACSKRATRISDWKSKAHGTNAPGG